MEDAPHAVRAAIRAGEWDGPTASLAPGFTQANLVALPAADAFDFLRFCVANPRPCPVIEVTEPGAHEPPISAPGADLRTDLPRYRVHVDGEVVDEPTDVRDVWREDLVAFLIGCSFTFERALLAAGLPVRHIEQGTNVPMYTTAVACHAAGRFAGPLVVSMRPMTPRQAIRATEITSRFTQRPRRAGAHRRPRDARDRRASRAPQFGDPVEIRDGEVPVFWACGVTPQAVAAASPPVADDHPRPRPHVRDRPLRRRGPMSFHRRRVPSHMLLTGKNAVIYGGGGSIGGAVARAFAREGANVFLAGRTLETLKAVGDEIGAELRRSSTRSTPRRSRRTPPPSAASTSPST